MSDPCIYVIFWAPMYMGFGLSFGATVLPVVNRNVSCFLFNGHIPCSLRAHIAVISPYTTTFLQGSFLSSTFDVALGAKKHILEAQRRHLQGNAHPSNKSNLSFRPFDMSKTIGGTEQLDRAQKAT